MVRAHPRYAAVAVALDASIGIIVAVTVFVLLYATNVTPSTQVVLVFSALLALAGIIGVGYTLLKNRFTGDKTLGFSDEFDDDEIDERY